MKNRLTLFASLFLLITGPSLARSHAEQSQPICGALSGLIPAEVTNGLPADCTCDGARMVEVGPVRIGGPAGGNGNIAPDCFFSTTITPAHYENTGEPRSLLKPTREPVTVVLRQCDTSGCYWLFGSASCAFDREIQAGEVQSFEVVGVCEEVVPG